MRLFTCSLCFVRVIHDVVHGSFSEVVQVFPELDHVLSELVHVFTEVRACMSRECSRVS